VSGGVVGAIRALARSTGLGRGLERTRYVTRLATDTRYRREALRLRQEFLHWRDNHAGTLGPALYPAGATKRVLIVTKGTLQAAQVELALIKGLELGGFVPTVLTNRTDLERYYRLGGVNSFIRWDRFRHAPPRQAADALVAAAREVDDLLGVEHHAARVGKFALSTTFRSLRVGRLDLASARVREVLSAHLASGMARAVVSEQILDAVSPAAALFMGNRYTGQGELMDVCLERGIDVMTWYDSHRSSSLMLKRYRRDNRDRHHGSISDETWEALQRPPWTDQQRQQLQREFHDSYAAGDWYSRGGTQVNKSIVPADRLRARLGLDPTKKTAVIFPHIVWDATLFWGADLFSNYEDWLVATVRAAAANSRLNWVIKIHPAHVAKGAAERFDGEPAELAAIRERVGPLPPHVSVIPPDTDINTYSLFAVMDYCLTVRGTIGIEAACLGKRVLTAGTGRYDHRGFTTDSGSRDEYLARLATLDTLPPLPASDRERAERFAFGAFVLRPWPCSSFTFAHDRNAGASMRVTVNARSSEELARSRDMCALGAWAANGRQEDFLWTAGDAAS
jgi:hypothetical protein